MFDHPSFAHHGPDATPLWAGGVDSFDLLMLCCFVLLEPFVGVLSVVV